MRGFAGLLAIIVAVEGGDLAGAAVGAAGADRPPRDAGPPAAAPQQRQALPSADDDWITATLKAALVSDGALESSDVAVDSRQGVVTLTGTVASEAQRQRALEIARSTTGVAAVADHLRVASDPRPAAARPPGPRR